MKKIILICLQILLLSSVLYPADTISAKYFPLAVGNKWVYLNANSIGGPYTYWTTMTQITKDTIAFSKRYFLINKIPFTSMINIWIRYDSTNGHLKYFQPNDPSCNYERMFYDLSDILGDSCNSNYTPCVFSIYVCNQILDSSIFGLNSTLKSYYYSFSDNNGGGSVLNTFAKYTGYLYYRHIYSGAHAQDYTYSRLKGATINGQIYGDTTLTNVQAINTSVPYKFSLSQNYPNPFNPMCNVQFSMLNAGNVRIVVYDIRGREVQTLVNEKLGAGTYEAKFDGSMLTSGMYFYKMIVRHGGSLTESFTETKRMVLIK